MGCAVTDQELLGLTFCRKVLQKLVDKARLTEPFRPDRRHGPHRALGANQVPLLDKGVDLRLSTDHVDLHAIERAHADPNSAALTITTHPINGHGLAFALHRNGIQRFGVEQPAHMAVGRFAEQNPAARRCVFDPLSCVNGISDDRIRAELLITHPTCEHLTRRDPDPDREVMPMTRQDTLAVVFHKGLHGDGCTDRTLRVVTVARRRAEERHQAIADVLVHRATKTAHAGSQPLKATVKDLADGLRLMPLTQARKAAHVGEQHRHQTDIVADRCGDPEVSLLVLQTTVGAELRIFGVVRVSASLASLARRHHDRASAGGSMRPNKGRWQFSAALAQPAASVGRSLDGKGVVRAEQIDDHLTTLGFIIRSPHTRRLITWSNGHLEFDLTPLRRLLVRSRWSLRPLPVHGVPHSLRNEYSTKRAKPLLARQLPKRLTRLSLITVHLCKRFRQETNFGCALDHA